MEQVTTAREMATSVADIRPRSFFSPEAETENQVNINQTPSVESSPIGSHAKTRQTRSCRIA